MARSTGRCATVTLTGVDVDLFIGVFAISMDDVLVGEHVVLQKSVLSRVLLPNENSGHSGGRVSYRSLFRGIVPEFIHTFNDGVNRGFSGPLPNLTADIVVL